MTKNIHIPGRRVKRQNAYVRQMQNGYFYVMVNEQHWNGNGVILFIYHPHRWI